MRIAENVNLWRCQMCILLDASIPQLLEPSDPKVILALEISRARHGPDAAVLRLVGCERERPSLQTHYSGSLRIQDVKEGVARDLHSPWTWSLETLKNIGCWLKSCILSHADCVRPRLGNGLPLRLIDILPTGLNPVVPNGDISLKEFNLLSLEELPQIHIAPSAELPPDTSYLTLSHRWADPPSLLLNKKTLFLLQCDISRHLLECSEAAVFRHAIHVTRGLGFRYIWIDALCIMQDNEAEMTTEIMRMDEIYYNSTLNISASEGQIREGLVFDRTILRVNPCETTVRILESQDMILQAFHERWFLRSSESPLNQRGWVFQEHVLAPRICHFTKDQVFWECSSLEASEVLPQGIPDSPLRYRSNGVKAISPSSLQQMKQRWYDLVERYSQTSLTFPNDRLLAISAVAKRFCLEMQLDPTQYLAGMWRDDLPLSMLWSQNLQQVMEGIKPTAVNITEMKKAPSWSWASLLVSTSPVKISSLGATAEVLDVQITRVSQNVFDGTSTCRLRLRGPVCKCRRRVQDGIPWVNIAQHSMFQEFGYFEFQRGKAIIIEWDTSRIAVSKLLKADGNLSARFTYFLLHIASENRPDGRIERGIALCRTALRGTYTRIGSFFVPFQSDYPGSELENAFNGRLNTLSADDYFELHHDGKYTIDII
ncbi:hypothetical protein HD806DRAFT_495435 [Xylariaceae sp. AK1471]|nr:hypothetical protein HD806DRAFT_495435 [Xylariaceae sp. AK1471]